MELNQIGYVKSDFEEPGDIKEMRKHRSKIVIDAKYIEGLYQLEKNDFIKIIFCFHESNGFDLKSERRHGDVKGVFSSRSPRRPNPIGSTTVKLIKINGNELIVDGLDAINNTPVLDIKPYSEELDSAKKMRLMKLKDDPRKNIRRYIENKDVEKVLVESGKLHGHFCPNLSLGVKAGVYGLNKLNTDSKGMEEVISIIETNSCFSDGVQYSSGCSFGNNSLIYRDYGKTAVTIAKRNGKALRFKVKNEANLIRDNYPKANDLFEKVIKERRGSDEEQKRLNKLWKKISFDLIKKDTEDLFKIDEVEPEIPDYAPIFEDEFCEECGEKVMAPKIVEKNQKKLCIPCAQKGYMELNGRGLVLKD